jgi:hypothetical protein
VVAHPLDVLGAEQEVRAERDVARIFQHVGEALAEQRVVERIDLEIIAPHRERFGGIALLVALEHARELVEHQSRPALKLQHHLVDDEGIDEDDHFLCDVLGKVADLFQIVADAQRTADVAQINRIGWRRAMVTTAFSSISRCSESTRSWAAMTDFARSMSRFTIASMDCLICASSSRLISTILSARVCKSVSNARVVCSTMWQSPSPQTGVFCLDNQSLARHEIFAGRAAKPRRHNNFVT